MFPLPISVAIPSYGWIAFLTYDVKTSLSTLHKAHLHSPVDSITATGKKLKARGIHSADGIIFLMSDGGPLRMFTLLVSAHFFCASHVSIAREFTRPVRRFVNKYGVRDAKSKKK